MSSMIGTTFGIYLGGATSPTAVAVTHLNVFVSNETENAIEVKPINARGETLQVRCWFPKSVLKLRWDEGKYGKCYEFKAWFLRKMDAYKASFIDRHAISGGISVSPETVRDSKPAMRRAA